jgi:hypothetical protein
LTTAFKTSPVGTPEPATTSPPRPVCSRKMILGFSVGFDEDDADDDVVVDEDGDEEGWERERPRVIVAARRGSSKDVGSGRRVLEL